MDRTGSHIRVVDPTFPVRRPEGLQLYLEKLQRGCFPVYIAKFLRASTMKNIWERPLKFCDGFFFNIFSFCFDLFWFFGVFLMKILGSSSDKDQSGIQSSLYNNMKRHRERL